MEPAEPEADELEAETPRNTAHGAGRAMGFLVVAAFVAGVVVVVYRLYPTGHPLPKNPNFIDAIFANNLVLFAARLVLLSAAGVLAVASVFIVISFWKRGKAGHWMSRFGPFETQAVEDLQGALEFWQNAWQEANDTRQALEQRIQESDETMGELYRKYEEALTELSRLQGTNG